jgi:hypothetical protein
MQNPRIGNVPVADGTPIAGWDTPEDLGPLRPGEKEWYSVEEFADALMSAIDKRYADTGSED